MIWKATIAAKMESETLGSFLDADANLPSGLNGLLVMLLSVEVSRSELENFVSSKLTNYTFFLPIFY